MRAVALWVRSVLRRRIGVTLALAVLTGIAAGVVGASFQAARRADGSVQRYAARSRSYDVLLQGCPPEVVDFATVTQSVPDAVAQCSNLTQTTRMGEELIAGGRYVEAWTVTGVLVAGVLDPAARNGWGHGAQIAVIGAPDLGAMFDHQILVAGRLAKEAAPDEIMIGERAARAGGIRVGDTLRLASWTEQDIGVGSSIGAPPETHAFESRVVGIMRSASDVSQRDDGDLTGAFLPDYLYARSGWVTAHGAEFATWGFGVAVRVHGGPADVASFESQLLENSKGWTLRDAGSVVDVDMPTLQRGVDAERQAVLIFALISGVASVAFVGLTLARQVRREQSDRSALVALGLSRASLICAAVLRALVVAAMAVVVAVATVLLLSPLGPVGLAGRLEYTHPIRFDWTVLGVLALVVPMFLALVAAITVIPAGRAARLHPTGRLSTNAMRLGPVSRAAVTFARGGSPRVAGLVGAVAVAVAVAAGTVVASFDRVYHQPVRYGAWWDVAIGQYSDPEQLQAGIQLLAHNPNVSNAAAILENPDAATVDGLTVNYLAEVPIIGVAPTVVASGRAPAAADEVALGAGTARKLHKGIGDTVKLGSPDPQVDARRTLHVTGIAVLNNPVSGATNAGDGIVVSRETANLLNGREQTAQSVVIKLVPTVDRTAAIESVVRDFPASARLATPQVDLTNLDRLHSVPWFLAGIIAMLALASLVHALVTLLQRHTGDLAVLAALGMTRRQRRNVGVVAGLALAGVSIAIGVPAGSALGRSVWRVVAHRVFVTSGSVTPWGSTVAAPTVALLVSVGIAAFAARWFTRRTPAAQLRAE